MNEMREEELRFVAKHYREDRLDTRKAWRRLLMSQGRQPGNRRKWVAVAASIALAIGIAVACVLVNTPRPMLPPAVSPKDSVKVGPDSVATKPSADSIRVFHFQDEPVMQALEEVGQYYGKVLSASDTAKHVSGDIQAGTLEETVDILEQTLGVNITVK